MPAFLFGQGNNTGPFGALRQVGIDPTRTISPSDKPVPDAAPPAGGLGQLVNPATTAAAAAAGQAAAGQQQQQQGQDQIDRQRPDMGVADP